MVIQNRKSQVFILDLVTSSVLAVVTFGIFFTYYYYSDPPTSLYDDLYDVSSAMSTLKINDLNNDFVRKLFIEQKITDVDNTILQQISVFYLQGNISDAIELVEEMSNSYIHKKVGYQIVLQINDSEKVVLDSDSLSTKSQSNNIAKIEKQIIGFYDSKPYAHQYTFEFWRG